MIEATQTEWKQLSVSEIADFLKTVADVSLPEGRARFQRYLDWILVCSSSDAEGFMVEEEGEHRMLSFDVLERAGFQVSLPDWSRMQALSHSLEEIMDSVQIKRDWGRGQQPIVSHVNVSRVL